jgi:hypothetical protein
MKFRDILEDKVPGGLSDGMNLDQICAKHKCNPEELDKQYKMGIKVEMEHTDDKEIAHEIVLDHLWEDKLYYTKLKKMEGE